MSVFPEKMGITVLTRGRLRFFISVCACASVCRSEFRCVGRYVCTCVTVFKRGRKGEEGEEEGKEDKEEEKEDEKEEEEKEKEKEKEE